MRKKHISPLLTVMMVFLVAAFILLNQEGAYSSDNPDGAARSESYQNTQTPTVLIQTGFVGSYGAASLAPGESVSPPTLSSI